MKSGAFGSVFKQKPKKPPNVNYNVLLNRIDDSQELSQSMRSSTPRINASNIVSIGFIDIGTVSNRSF